MFQAYKKTPGAKIMENEEYIQSMHDRLVYLESELNKKEIDMNLGSVRRKEQDELLNQFRIVNDLKTNIIKQQEEHAEIFLLDSRNRVKIIEEYKNELKIKNDKIIELEKMITNQLAGVCQFMEYISKHNENIIEERKHIENNDNPGDPENANDTKITHTNNFEPNRQIIDHDKINEPFQRKLSTLKDPKDLVVNKRNQETVVKKNSNRRTHTTIIAKKELQDNHSPNLSTANSENKYYKLNDKLDKVAITIMNAKHACQKLVEEAILLRNVVIQHILNAEISAKAPLDHGKNVISISTERISNDEEWLQIAPRLQSFCIELTSIREHFEKQVDQYRN